MLWGRTHSTRGQRLLGAVVQPTILAPFKEGARKREFHGLRVLWQVTEQERVQRPPPHTATKGAPSQDQEALKKELGSVRTGEQEGG